MDVKGHAWQDQWSPSRAEAGSGCYLHGTRLAVGCHRQGLQRARKARQLDLDFAVHSFRPTKMRSSRSSGRHAKLRPCERRLKCQNGPCSPSAKCQGVHATLNDFLRYAESLAECAIRSMCLGCEARRDSARPLFNERLAFVINAVFI